MKSRSIETEWPQHYQADLLPGLPATGPEPVDLRATTHGHGREGLVVRVRAGTRSWIGNFQRGDGKLTGIFATPSPDHMCVIASGRGYWLRALDATDCHIVRAYPIQDVRAIAELSLLVFADYTDLVAYGVEGMRWLSQSVSWDGITILSADQNGILGLGWDARIEKEVGFFVDVRSGRVEGGAAPHVPGAQS